MRSKVQPWGNSIGVRIPKPLADELGVRGGSAVDLSVEEGRLVLRPVRKRPFRLKDLLANVTDANRHSEIDRGAAKGDEAW
jgi:antitoxin MazE